MADDSLRDEVLAADALRISAMLEADVATLSRIISEDYIHVQSKGDLRNKQQFLGGLQAAQFRFDSFVVDENHVALHGDIAIVTGRYHNVVRTAAGPGPVKHARHIRVYVRRNGAWINTVHQATEIAQP